jgi:hypothetical protein
MPLSGDNRALLDPDSASVRLDEVLTSQGYLSVIAPGLHCS